LASRLIEQFDISEEAIRRVVADTMHGADDGELFLESSESESLLFDNGRLKTANYNTDRGFGLRAVAGESTGYAHSSETSEAALLRAADAVSAVKSGYSGKLGAAARTNRKLYGDENPLSAPGFEEKCAFCRRSTPG
jgi:TldD protein